MTPEKAYEEALRRIREAEKTGAEELFYNAESTSSGVGSPHVGEREGGNGDVADDDGNGHGS